MSDGLSFVSVGCYCRILVCDRPKLILLLNVCCCRCSHHLFCVHCCFFVKQRLGLADSSERSNGGGILRHRWRHRCRYSRPTLALQHYFLDGVDGVDGNLCECNKVLGWLVDADADPPDWCTSFIYLFLVFSNRWDRIDESLRNRRTAGVSCCNCRVNDCNAMYGVIACCTWLLSVCGLR